MASVLNLLVSLTIAASPAADFGWQTATPESQGVSLPKLEALAENLALKMGFPRFVHKLHDDNKTTMSNPGKSPARKRSSIEKSRIVVIC